MEICRPLFSSLFECSTRSLRIIKKALIASLLFLPGVVHAFPAVSYIFNPYTGRLDAITATSTNTFVAGSNMTIQCFVSSCTFSASGSGGGGGSSTLYTTQNGIIITSPTVALSAVSPLILTSLGGTTTQFSINLSSVTGQGPVVSSITLSAMYGAPTLVGTNFTSLPGAQVGSGVPAANIATGSLGPNVIASSVTAGSLYPFFSATQPAFFSNGVISVSGVSLSTGVVGSLPATSIAAGKLGSGVIASSVAVGTDYPGSTQVGTYNNISIPGSNITSVIPSTVLPSTIAFLGNAQTFTNQTSFSGTVTHTSSVTFNANVGINDGQYYGNINTVTPPYTVTSTDTILAVIGSSGQPINLPSASSSAGQWLHIFKSDTSGSSVTIVTNGSDLIAGTTNTWALYALGQSISLKASGTNWWPTETLKSTPAFLGFSFNSQNAAVVTSSAALFQEVTIDQFVRISSMEFSSGGVQNGTVDTAIYDIYGNQLTNNGGLLLSGGAQIVISTMTPVNLNPGIYWLAFKCTSATATFQKCTNSSPNFGVISHAETTATLPSTEAIKSFTASASAANQPPCLLAVPWGAPAN